MNPKKAPVSCPVSALFEVLQHDLELGICCDIYFTAANRKHRFGAWGDNGNTFQNVRFYLDHQEFSSFDELKNAVLPDGTLLVSYPDPILIKECDGCYPREDQILERYYQAKQS